MTEREFDLSERAEALDLELRRDDDGLYWLDYIGCQEMRSAGPFDLDEIEDQITAAECGMSTMQRGEFCEDRRWRRIQP